MSRGVVAEICFLAVIPACIAAPFVCIGGPFVCLAKCAQGGCRNLARKKYRRRESPSRHAPRKRRLTRSNSAAELGQTQHDQEQCKFLQLPWELREKIYNLVFEDRRLHMKLAADKGLNVNRIRLSFCRRPGVAPDAEEDDTVSHWGVWYDHFECFGLPQPDYPAVGHSAGLALLQTCRRIYSDAIDFLYTSTVFHPMETQCLFQLERMLLPQRLNTIKSLEVRMRLDGMFVNRRSGAPKKLADVQYHEEVMDECREALGLIASMRGLRELRLVMRLNPFYLRWWEAVRPSFVEGIERINGLAQCDAYFTQPYGHRWEDVISGSVRWGSCDVHGIDEMVSRLHLK